MEYTWLKWKMPEMMKEHNRFYLFSNFLRANRRLNQTSNSFSTRPIVPLLSYHTVPEAITQQNILVHLVTYKVWNKNLELNLRTFCNIHKFSGHNKVGFFSVFRNHEKQKDFNAPSSTVSLPCQQNTIFGSFNNWKQYEKR